MWRPTSWPQPTNGSSHSRPSWHCPAKAIVDQETFNIRYPQAHTRWHAMTLAHILREDAHLHRRLPTDSELCRSIAVLARAHQGAIWARTKAYNELRWLLHDFYPAFLATFAGRFALGISSPGARALLAIAPMPGQAITPSVTRIAAALRRAGRSRGIGQAAADIKAALRKP